MLATRLGPGRPAVKRDEILSRLKRDIIEGNAPPGARLPGRNELQQRFSASTATLQQALNRLIADGFVRVESGRGTFVVDTPPYLARYGLVFYYLPGGGHGFGRMSRFYEA